MRYRLAVSCRDFFLRNRHARMYCALVTLSILTLLLVWTILKPKKPAVYGILDLGGIKEGQDLTTKERTSRITILRGVFVLGPAVKDLKAAGQRLPKPDGVDGVRWLIEKLWVGSLEESSRVCVGLTEGTPAEQAFITNAVLRAYVREITRKEEDWLNLLVARDRTKIMREVSYKAYLLPELRRGKEENNRLIKQLIGDRLDRARAARKEEVRAARGSLPVVVEWAPEP